MNKRASSLFTLAGAALLLAAALLTAFNFLQSAQADASSASAGAALTDAIAANLPPQTDEPLLPDYVLNPDMPMPAAEVDGASYLGLLELPALELSLPVQSEWSYPALSRSPCRYTGSVYRGDMVVAAHNYRSHFGRLSRAAIGDEVRFTDMDGNLFRYEIAELEILSPAAIEEMTLSGWDLTLFTCTLGGQTRLAVRCALLESVPAGAP